MPFHWLEMRITEERDRRVRESEITARLPKALEEIYCVIQECIERYADDFGSDTAQAALMDGAIHVVTREETAGAWHERQRIEITTVPTLPGIEVCRNGERTQIEIGILPGDRVFYKLGEDYLTMEALTQHLLDRALFPKLVA